MEPPVKKRILQSRPHVKKIKFDLYNDLPEDIGSRFEDSKKTIYFKESDSLLILDAIAEHLAEARGENENVVFDLHTIGLMPTEVGSIISANLRLWDDVVNLSYAAPRKSESIIFETKIFPISV